MPLTRYSIPIAKMKHYCGGASPLMWFGEYTVWQPHPTHQIEPHFPLSPLYHFLHPLIMTPIHSAATIVALREGQGYYVIEVSLSNVYKTPTQE